MEQIHEACVGGIIENGACTDEQLANTLVTETDITYPNEIIIMSGIKKLVQYENKGLEQVTNADLQEEGTGADRNSDDK